MAKCDKLLTPEQMGFNVSSSDIKSYDGTTLVDVVLPTNPTLNDVIKAVDDEFVDHQTQIDAVATPISKTSEITDWDGTSTFTCFVLTPSASLAIHHIYCNGYVCTKSAYSCNISPAHDKIAYYLFPFLYFIHYICFTYKSYFERCYKGG